MKKKKRKENHTLKWSQLMTTTRISSKWCYFKTVHAIPFCTSYNRLLNDYFANVAYSSTQNVHCWQKALQIDY